MFCPLPGRGREFMEKPQPLRRFLLEAGAIVLFVLLA
jgi:hypothetical protein